ncbi:hypothetical protein [Actinomadura keratinilytica]
MLTSLRASCCAPITQYPTDRPCVVSTASADSARRRNSLDGQ